MTEHMEVWNEQTDTVQGLAVIDVAMAGEARERQAGPRQQKAWDPTHTISTASEHANWHFSSDLQTTMILAPLYWCFWTVVLEKTLKSPLDCKEIQLVHPKGNQSWIFIGRTDAEAETPILWPTWGKELTHWKRPWCWERWKAGGEGDDRGWDGWMASLTRWTWVWVNSGSGWWTGRPAVLQSMGSQRVGHEWTAELILSPFYVQMGWGRERSDLLNIGENCIWHSFLK